MDIEGLLLLLKEVMGERFAHRFRRGTSRSFRTSAAQARDD